MATDIERRIKERPVEVEVFGDELGGVLAGIRARKDQRLLELMAEQALIHVSFFGECPPYILNARKMLQPGRRQRIDNSLMAGGFDIEGSDSILLSFRS